MAGARNQRPVYRYPENGFLATDFMVLARGAVTLGNSDSHSAERRNPNKKTTASGGESAGGRTRTRVPTEPRRSQLARLVQHRYEGSSLSALAVQSSRYRARFELYLR